MARALTLIENDIKAALGRVVRFTPNYSNSASVRAQSARAAVENYLFIRPDDTDVQSLYQEILGFYGNPDSDSAVSFEKSKRYHRACRIFSGSGVAIAAADLAYAAPASGGYVDSMTTTVPCDAHNFFLILANFNTAAELVIVGANMCVAPTIAARPYNALAKTAFAFAGGAGVNIAVAPSAGVPTLVVTNDLKMSTIDRTDGGEGKIVHFRVAATAANDQTKLSVWSRSGPRWTDADVRRGAPLYTFLQPGNLASAIGNAGYEDGGSMIFGFGYTSENKVKTVFVSGDSFVENANGGSQNSSFYVEGIEAASTETAPIEYGSMGYGGQQASFYQDRLSQFLAIFKPSAVIFGSTPNLNMGDDAGLNLLKQEYMDTLKFCEANDIVLCGTTIAPNTNAGNTASNYDADDIARKLAHNEWVKSMGPCIDIAAKTTGNKTLDLWVAGATTDGVHPEEEWSGANLVPYVAQTVAVL